MKNLTIGQLSDVVGLPTKTIRFYEEQGVISKADRAENSYRVYEKNTVAELQLIKQARDLGLPLSQIKKLMKGCEGKSCQHTQQELHQEIADYVKLLEEKIAQFTLLKKKMMQLQTKMDSTTEHCSYCCNILHQLLDPEKPKGGEKTMTDRTPCPCGECSCGNCNC